MAMIITTLADTDRQQWSLYIQTKAASNESGKNTIRMD